MGRSVAIGVHILTRESQEVMSMFISIIGVRLPDDDSVVDTMMVDACFGQLNITTSSLPNSPS